VKILKPYKGVHFQKLNPMIQDVDYIYEKDYKVSDTKNLSSENKKNMLKHRKNTMIRISPLDMPNNDYFKYIDERMIELGIKESDNKPKGKRNIMIESGDSVFSKKIQTRNQEIQATPDPVPTKVYIDRS